MCRISPFWKWGSLFSVWDGSLWCRCLVRPGSWWDSLEVQSPTPPLPRKNSITTLLEMFAGRCLLADFMCVLGYSLAKLSPLLRRSLTVYTIGLHRFHKWRTTLNTYVCSKHILCPHHWRWSCTHSVISQVPTLVCCCHTSVTPGVGNPLDPNIPQTLNEHKRPGHAFIHLSIHSFTQYRLNASYLLGTASGARDTEMNQTCSNLCSHGVYIQCEGNGNTPKRNAPSG